MRYAVLSDVHANLAALAAVLEAVDRLEIDRTVCLGDVVGYHDRPNECVELIRQRQIPCVRGNHDWVAIGRQEPVEFSPSARWAILWTRRRLTAGSRQFLGGLPGLECGAGPFVMVHAALHPRPNSDLRLQSVEDSRGSFAVLEADYPDQRICFFGHTHRCVAYECRGETVTALPGERLQLRPEARYLINPGSVGLPRDGHADAAFAVYDTEQAVVQFHRVAYPHAGVNRVGQPTWARLRPWLSGITGPLKRPFSPARKRLSGRGTVAEH